MNSTFTNPSSTELKALLENIHTIAVVGLSPKEKRPSHQVAKHMQQYGYRIIPIRPAIDELLGEKAYASIGELDQPVDLVNIFLSPDKLTPVIDSCIKHKIRAIWIQEGIINEAEALRAQQAGITVIMDRCIYKDYCTLVSATRQD
ncbi:MAG: CoA-binding protein [Gammaproteobacteria bacterium]|nr:CoA-binding protein [Gammaproteobacteria bacterium]